MKDIEDNYFSFSSNIIAKRLFSGVSDKNNTEIYDGDVLKGRKDYLYEVRFEYGNFVCYHLTSKERCGTLSRLFDPDMKEIYNVIEVIGDIYTTPEFISK